MNDDTLLTWQSVIGPLVAYDVVIVTKDERDRKKRKGIVFTIATWWYPKKGQSKPNTSQKYAGGV